MCLIIAANKSFLNQSYMLTVREPRFYTYERFKNNHSPDSQEQKHKHISHNTELAKASKWAFLFHHGLL